MNGNPLAGNRKAGSVQVGEGYNPGMSVDDLEAEALKLDPQNRARLAEKLLASLEDLSEEETALLWAEEAARRDVAWDRNAEGAKPARAVFRDTRARLE